MTPTEPFHGRDADAFFAELEAMTQQAYADRGPGDVRHARKMEAWGWVATLVGYGTAGMGVNPVAMLGMALGMSCRWMIVAHHVLHRGYDAYPDAPSRYRSAMFGRGWRRWRDWCDWMPPRAWAREHNVLHHFRLGEDADPGVPEVNLRWLAAWPLPRAIKLLLLLPIAMHWKGGFYGPDVIQAAARTGKTKPEPFSPVDPATWNPFHPMGRRVWRESWLPYALVRFGLLPLLFLPLGRACWLAALINTVCAEWLTNLHTFLVIVPNHAGGDVPRFTGAARDKNEHRLRQIIGSVNYRTGGDARDFLHGWLNYQIEHHLWPDLSLRQYQKWQPRLRALCERHGVPYRQESVWTRVRRMADNVTGKTRMPVFATADAAWTREGAA